MAADKFGTNFIEPAMLKYFFLFLLFPAFCAGQMDNDTARIVDLDSVDYLKPAITGFGKPAGYKISEPIGKDGGKIISDDGLIEITIPAGALDKKTEISIQPVVNMLQEDIGKGYKLEPENIQFNEPVEILFHYGDRDLGGFPLKNLRIGYQDKQGKWRSIPWFTVDSVKRTISTRSKHFSTWIKLRDNYMIPKYDVMKVNTQRSITIFLIKSTSPRKEDWTYEGDDIFYFEQEKDIVWRVNGIKNGNAEVGMITWSSTSAGGATYKAPQSVPKMNPVAISAQFEWKWMGKKNRNYFVSNIRIVDKAYLFTFISHNNQSGTYIVDSSSCVFTIVDNKVYMSDVINWRADFYSTVKCVQFHNMENFLGPVEIRTMTMGLVYPKTEKAPLNVVVRFGSFMTSTPSYTVRCGNKPYTSPPFFFLAVPPSVWFASEGDEVFIKGDNGEFVKDEVRSGDAKNYFIMRIRKF